MTYMNRLRRKIGVGYAVIILLMAGIGCIGLNGWRRQAQAAKKYQEIGQFQRNTRDIDFRIAQLSLIGESVMDWEKADFDRYHAKRMELDCLLCLLSSEGALPKVRIDSLRLSLEGKENNLYSIMALLDRQDSLSKRIARQVPMIARKSAQEKQGKGRRKILGLFGPRKRPKQTETTAMLHTLDRNVISRHKEQGRRIEEYADSMTERNKRLNQQLERLVRGMEEKAQDDMRAWEKETAALKRQNSLLTGSLSALAVLLLSLSYIVICRSVSRTRHYKKRKAELIAKLEDTVRQNGELMEGRKKLMHTITHELRTPLSAISGYAELLQGAEDGDKRTRYIRSIRTSAGRMSSMLDTLLSFFRLESGKESAAKVPFTLKNIAGTLETEFLPLAESKGLDLNVMTCKDIVLMGDKERVLQIGGNLLSNAVKFTEEGSVNLSISHEGGKLVLVVEDTGTGMGEREQERIFGAFERLSNAATQDGFGLGLSIVRRTADLLGGAIRVESEKGKGSRFTVELPMDTAEALPKEEKARTAHTHDIGKPMSVIALDDNEPLLMMTMEMLSANGISCDAVTNVSDLTEMMRVHDYDLLITDMKMPETNGYEVLELLRSSNVGNSKYIPVVVSTASGSCTKEDLLDAGFTGCLFKPFSISDLLETCVTCVKGGNDAATPDFTALLSWGDRKAMLDKIVESTEDEMRKFRDAAERMDVKALHDMIHHLRSSWMVMRTEKPLQRLHDALGKPEFIDNHDKELREAVSAVLATGRAIITKAKEERMEHDGTDNRG